MLNNQAEILQTEKIRVLRFYHSKLSHNVDAKMTNIFLFQFFISKTQVVQNTREWKLLG